MTLDAHLTLEERAVKYSKELGLKITTKDLSDIYKSLKITKKNLIRLKRPQLSITEEV